MATRRRTIRSILALLVLGGLTSVLDARIPMAIRGSSRKTTTVLMQPEGKVLTVRIEKRDLNIYDGPDELLAILFAPDRTVVAKVTLPDDGVTTKGGAGRKIASRVIRVRDVRPGTYRLRVMPRNGDQVFGVKANCRKVMLDSPLFFNDGSLAGDVYFQPPDGDVKITASAMHKPGVQKLAIHDSAGRRIGEMNLPKPGQEVTFTAPKQAARGPKPWRIRIAKQDVKLEIPGLTYWSPAADGLFAAAKTRWLLTPYRQRIDLMPGAQGRLEFEVRNSSGKPARIQVSTVSAAPARCRVVSPAKPVRVKPDGKAIVTVAVSTDAGAAVGAKANCSVQAAYVDDPQASESVGVEVRVGASQVSQPLKLPIQQRLYEHENMQFGYLPPYPCNPPHFDQANRPFIRWRSGSKDATTGIYTLADGQWVERSFLPAIKAKHPDFVKTTRSTGWQGTRTVFDKDNHLYTLVKVGLATKKVVQLLLYSRDQGKTYQVYDLPCTTADLEHKAGHNPIVGPPAVVMYTHTRKHPARFGSYNDLQLLFPRKTADGLDLGRPVMVSRLCFGACMHSGNPPAVVTRDGKTHVIWGEIDDSGVPGVPTYVATYDPLTGTMGKKVFLAHAPPVNDVHNAPGIVVDSEGYLHAVTGAHGAPFKYLRSLKPNDAHSGWTQPADLKLTGYTDKKKGVLSRQTYLALMCDSRDTLHIAYRQWRNDAVHKGGIYAALSYQRKPKGQPWQDAQPIVTPPLPSYSIYYHKMTLDRRDRLYLSYSYFSIDEGYRNDLPELYDYRAVVTSKDGGDTWKLAETSDFEGE